jgi:hypothetical protein
VSNPKSKFGHCAWNAKASLEPHKAHFAPHQGCEKSDATLLHWEKKRAYCSPLVTFTHCFASISIQDWNITSHRRGGFTHLFLHLVYILVILLSPALSNGENVVDIIRFRADDFSPFFSDLIYFFSLLGALI